VAAIENVVQIAHALLVLDDEQRFGAAGTGGVETNAFSLVSAVSTRGSANVITSLADGALPFVQPLWRMPCTVGRAGALPVVSSEEQLEHLRQRGVVHACRVAHAHGDMLTPSYAA
jgi:hypothetical protein